MVVGVRPDNFHDNTGLDGMPNVPGILPGQVGFGGAWTFLCCQISIVLSLMYGNRDLSTCQTHPTQAAI